MKHWEGLPLLFAGQDIGEVGPIESSIHVRHESYPLPQGFEWCISVNDIIQDLNSMKLLERFSSCSQCNMRYLLGIKLSSSKK